MSRVTSDNAKMTQRAGREEFVNTFRVFMPGSRVVPVHFGPSGGERSADHNGSDIVSGLWLCRGDGRSTACPPPRLRAVANRRVLQRHAPLDARLRRRGGPGPARCVIPAQPPASRPTASPAQDISSTPTLTPSPGRHGRPPTHRPAGQTTNRNRPPNHAKTHQPTQRALATLHFRVCTPNRDCP